MPGELHTLLERCRAGEAPAWESFAAWVKVRGDVVLGSVENIGVIAEILSDYPDVPVILDPVQASGRDTHHARPFEVSDTTWPSSIRIWRGS